MSVSLPQLVKSPRKGVMPGNPACMGCPHTIGLKIVGRVLGDRAVLVVPAGCTSIIVGYGGKESLDMAYVHVPFASAAAVAAGLAAAFEKRGLTDRVVVAWMGDGGGADIGFATLSGAAIRNDNIIAIVSDNEAYMNTGIQASSTTPWKARTTTSPVIGKTEEKKDLATIMLMHKVPYVATASVGYPLDFAAKLKRAAEIKGFRFIHLHSPCPTGWRFDASKTVEMAKLAVETGAWILWEYNQGRFEISPPSKPFADPSKRKPLKDYIRAQGRFSHLTDEDIEFIARKIEENWRVVQMLEKLFSS